jgi:hypothetical protein
VSFLRFAKELYKLLKVGGQLVWRMEYRNIGGCILPPYLPDAGVMEQPKAYPVQHFGPISESIETDFDPDGAAFELIRKFYQVFGFSQKHIPLFADGKFAPEKWGR